MHHRGFKTWAEREAVEWRRDLGLRPHSPLAACVLAVGLGVSVMAPSGFPGMTKEILATLARHRDSWSAFTLPARDRHIVVLNPWHSPARQESDLMHELAHIYIGHSPSTVVL